jgi:hypothetical protein
MSTATAMRRAVIGMTGCSSAFQRKPGSLIAKRPGAEQFRSMSSSKGGRLIIPSRSGMRAGECWCLLIPGCCGPSALNSMSFGVADCQKGCLNCGRSRVHPKSTVLIAGGWPLHRDRDHPQVDTCFLR